MRDSSRSNNTLAGPSMALGSMFSAQLGAAVAVPLMSINGTFDVTAVRLACVALIMILWVRPQIFRYSRQQWSSAIALAGRC